MLPTRHLESWAAGVAAMLLCLGGCSTSGSKVKPATQPAASSVPAPALAAAVPAPTGPAPGVAASTVATPADAAASSAPTAAAPGTAALPDTAANAPLAATPPAAPPRVLDKLFPQPPALDPDVNFWIRVYTEIGTNAGFLHDQYNLSVVYQTLQFGPDTSSRQRERMVEAARVRIVAALKRIAKATGPLAPEDQRIRDLWGDEGTPQRLLGATDDVRFQLGQADRFRDGLLRSGLWEPHIEETLANLGLPAQLGVVPHVESSFNAAAYSKAGAAGLWQFMRSTGRRYMRIDSAVDDRMDPFRSTEAAAQLLSFNYRLLGTWPLALTAYNHGAEGMRRATAQLGTDDIVKILRDYHSPSFGFASRNYYVSFLAALTVDRNPEQYFGPIKREPEAKFQEVVVPGFVTVSALTHALNISADALRRLNPALLPACWQGRRRVPKGYVLRLPLAGPGWTPELLAAQLSPSQLQATQTVPERRKVLRGETLASIASEYGMKPGELARLNGISPRTHLRPGRMVRVPEANPVPVIVARVDHSNDQAADGAATVAAVTPAVAGGISPQVAQQESEQDARAVAQDKPLAATQPVSAQQAEAITPALGPAVIVAADVADATDYSVAADDTIVVAATETLGAYAGWLNVSPARLRALNHLRRRGDVQMGHKLKLDFANSSHAQFEAQRRDYHRQMQAAYFASHRISGTVVHVARRGDSLWNLTHRFGDLPVWLLQQYNPDVAFDDLRAGTQIILPRVADLGSSAADD